MKHRPHHAGMTGFPSPADDFMETGLDLNAFFVPRPSASFFWRVRGNGMNRAGILDGGYLLVDRSLSPSHNDVVLAVIDGEVTVTRCVRIGNKLELRPPCVDQDNERGYDAHTDTIEIWGVVSAAFNTFRR